MAKGASNTANHRQLRVGELVRHAITQVLVHRGINDPVLDNVVISVSEVRMSTDLRVATCFISPLGSENADNIVTALNRSTSYIRKQAGKDLRQLKFMPEFRFVVDTSYDNFGKIDALLRSPKVMRDIEAPDDDQDDGDDTVEGQN